MSGHTTVHTPSFRSLLFKMEEVSRSSQVSPVDCTDLVPDTMVSVDNLKYFSVKENTGVKWFVKSSVYSGQV